MSKMKQRKPGEPLGRLIDRLPDKGVTIRRKLDATPVPPDPLREKIAEIAEKLSEMHPQAWLARNTADGPMPALLKALEEEGILEDSLITARKTAHEMIGHYGPDLIRKFLVAVRQSGSHDKVFEILMRALNDSGPDFED